MGRSRVYSTRRAYANRRAGQRRPGPPLFPV